MQTILMPVVGTAVTAPVAPAWLLPFAGLLLAIAVMPFVARHWWERWQWAVVAGLVVLLGGYYLGVRREADPLLRALRDYVSFIALLGSLYIVSGGILIDTGGHASPRTNTLLLLLGAALANVIGTTGAAMLLIRPYLRLNRPRVRPYHVVFFIFIVANAGGCLTPIGDPPLFLGYLRGVPFWWAAEHLWQPWLLVVGLLLAVFYGVDRYHYRRHRAAVLPKSSPDPPPHAPPHPGRRVFHPSLLLAGTHNLLFIALIVVGVFRPNVFACLTRLREQGLRAELLGQLALSREVLMLVAVLLSRLTTKAAIYRHHAFTYLPIREVAVLFVGLFVTLAPALEWLDQNAARLPLRTPGQFYFATGALSAVLDNAPTYLTFLEARLGAVPEAQVAAAEVELAHMRQTRNLAISENARDPQVRRALAALVRYHGEQVLHTQLPRDQVALAFLLGIPELNAFIVAISAAAVFFGACTYIGNGPNFMVKSIADAGGLAMPGFFAYVWRYALPVLVPVLGLVWVVFFAGR